MAYYIVESIPGEWDSVVPWNPLVEFEIVRTELSAGIGMTGPVIDQNNYRPIIRQFFSREKAFAYFAELAGKVLVAMTRLDAMSDSDEPMSYCWSYNGTGLVTDYENYLECLYLVAGGTSICSVGGLLIREVG